MKKVFIWVLIPVFLFSSLFMVSTVSAAKRQTLGDLKNELNALQKKQADNNALSAKTKQEIQTKRNSIASANNEIEANQKKVEEAKQKIAESEKEIEKTNAELNDLMRYLQMTKSENVYLEYLANASSISDLIKRTSVVQQVSTYQKEEINRLENLIKEKEQLQKDLAETNKQLEAQIKEYEKKIEELDKYVAQYAQIGVSTAQEIKAQQQSIKIYEQQGCKESEYIDDCVQRVNSDMLVRADGFLRPFAAGRVNSLYGRAGGHYGIDLGGVSQGHNVYATAPGVVAATWYKQPCGGNIVYIHHNVNGQSYTTEYAHLLQINVSPGQVVTTATVIGLLGGGPSTWSYDSCTTGAHLHYTIATGHYLGVGSSGYRSRSTFYANSKVTINSSISGLVNQKGWSWNTR